MATFHQEGQMVQYQYNAETINFGVARTPVKFLLRYLSALAPLPEPLKNTWEDSESWVLGRTPEL